jgi:hypothetical protein
MCFDSFNSTLEFPTWVKLQMVEASHAEDMGPKVSIKTLSDRAITFNLDEKLKYVGDIRQKLAEKENIEVGKITLISQGVILADDVLVSTIPSSIQPSTQIITTTIHWFYMEPTALSLDPIESAKDWDSKNRLRCFKGIYSISRRNFKEAAGLLVDCMATFQDLTFLPFKELVKYAAIAALLVSDRPSLNEKVIKSPEVLEVINDLPQLKNLIESFYLCNYGSLFQALGTFWFYVILLTPLADVEKSLASDWLLSEHIAYVVKEMRVRAYAQMLQSYRSLSLDSMANSFGVSVEFIDKYGVISRSFFYCFVENFAVLLPRDVLIA